MRTHPFCRSWSTKEWFDLHKILDLRLVNGKREWLVAWAGTDCFGIEWDNS